MSDVWQGHDFGWYDAPSCGGLMAKSGKGKGARQHGTRHQTAVAFPAWGKRSGSDVYFSSRWDNGEQIYDHFHTPKNVTFWWETAPWGWVFIQEVVYDLRSQEFKWDGGKTLPSSKTLRKKRRRQERRHLRHLCLM